MAGTAADEAREGPRSLRELMRRTWEMELLISGAVVFALLQIPQRLDAWLGLLEPHLGFGLGILPFVAYTYLKLITYTLVATFVLHLAARGYWIGLIGLDSIFPDGVRWQKLDGGPISRRLQRETLPTLRRLIAAADRFCSSIFSFAFMVVFNFGFSIVLSVPVVALAYFLSQRFFDERAVVPLFLAIWLLLLGPQILFGLLDRVAGKRISPDGRLGRLTRRVLAFYSKLLLLPLHGPILATFSTNVRKSVVYPVFYGILFAMLALFLSKDVLMRRGALSFSSYVWAPEDAGPYGVDPRHYEDLGGARRAARPLPTLQSIVADGPYLKLFLPYRPASDNEVLAELCEGAVALRGEGLRLRRRGAERQPDERLEAARDCLVRLFRVTLDAAPVDLSQASFYRHPDSGQRGLLAMLPVAGLDPGRHLLVVDKMRARDSDDPEAPESRSYHLPFWR